MPSTTPLLAARETGQLFITPMREDEAEELSSLFGNVLRDLPYYNQQAKFCELAKYTSKHLSESVHLDPGSVLVAKAYNTTVGFCFSREDDSLIWLSWIGVDPKHRRKGIATALLDTLCERARKSRSHKIWCDSRSNNGEAIKLFTNHGYQRICAIRNHWHRQDFILWEKLVV